MNRDWYQEKTYCDAFDKYLEANGSFDGSTNHPDWEVEPSFYPNHPWELLILASKRLHLNHIYTGKASQVTKSDFTLKTVVRPPLLRAFPSFFGVTIEAP